MTAPHPLVAAARLRFLARIHDASLLRAGGWLFAYTVVPAAVAGALCATLLAKVAPGLYATSLGAMHDMSPLPTVLFYPFIETLMLGALIIQIGRQHGEQKAVMLAALLMAAFHSLNNLLWGVSGLALFLVHAWAFAQLYEEDRQRAFAVPMLAHALHNAVVMGGMMAWRAW